MKINKIFRGFSWFIFIFILFIFIYSLTGSITVHNDLTGLTN